MITGTHAIIYANDADRVRAFFRDVLGLANVDAHGGWLIFKLPPAELGIHPAAAGSDGGPGAAGSDGGPGAAASGRHELFLMCDDIEATVAELSARGAEFTGPVADRGFGLLTTIRVPGGGELGLYQPKHPTAHDLDG